MTLIEKHPQENKPEKQEMTDLGLVTAGRFSDDYKNTAFYIWYRSGKPTAGTLSGKLEPTIDGSIPAKTTISSWITEEFIPRASVLDELVFDRVNEKAASEKADMLIRHAEIGRKMQELSIQYLEDHADNLKVNNAVRMLVDGIKIERESLGLPSLIAEVTDKTDEGLMKRLNELLSVAENEIELEKQYLDG